MFTWLIKEQRSRGHTFILQERLASDAAEVNLVRELLSTHTRTYVDEVLYPHFGALIAFVNDTEPLIEQQHTETLRRYTRALFIANAFHIQNDFRESTEHSAVVRQHVAPVDRGHQRGSDAELSKLQNR